MERRKEGWDKTGKEDRKEARGMSGREREKIRTLKRLRRKKM